MTAVVIRSAWTQALSCGEVSLSRQKPRETFLRILKALLKVKIKVTLELATKAKRGNRSIALLFNVDEGGGHCHTPAALPPVKRLSTQCAGAG